MNYSARTDKQLNDECAKRMGWSVKTHGGVGFAWFDKKGHYVIDDCDWEPCHEDSNQSETYLFPKLLDTGLRLEAQINKNIVPDFVIRDRELSHWFCFKFAGHPNGNFQYNKHQGNCKFEEINKNKVIAFLKALDVLEAKS